MLAAAGPLPSGPGWAYEFKYDGVRAVTYAAGEAVRVYSRNGNDVSGTYPELAEVAALLGGRSAVVDGEIVAPAEGDRPSFARLQSRMHVAAPTAALLGSVPVRYYVFDLLSLDGESLAELPYEQRRDRLRGLGLAGDVVRVPSAFTEAHGLAVLRAAEIAGFEGVVAKRLAAPYRPGKRSADWTKVPLIRTQEVLIIGYETGEGRRAGTVGALLLGILEDQQIRYAGQVGTGFTDAMLRHLQEQLDVRRRATSPAAGVPREHARKARWVEPDLVGEVAFRNWTPDGRLRHASWRGLRSDQPGTAAARRTAPAVPPAAPEVRGAMETPDGRWRVEVIRRGDAESFRIVHGDNVVEGLDIDGVQELLARRGVDMHQLRQVDPAA
jgi:bifunctional non-homologous end joining protein LigD